MGLSHVYGINDGEVTPRLYSKTTPVVKSMEQPYLHEIGDYVPEQ